MTRPPSPKEARSLDLDVTIASVMAVLRTALDSLRTERDPVVIEARLDHADALTRLDDASRAFTDDVSPPLAALAMFAARCQHAGDFENWQWGRNVFRTAGLDILEVIDATAPLVTSSARICFDVPVAEFQTEPEHYQLVSLSEIPYAHNPFKCDHRDIFQNELARLANRERRSRPFKTLLGLRVRSGHEIELAAGEAMQQRVLRGDLPVCGKHLPVDWKAINRQAVQIRDETRPWTRATVISAIEGADVSTDEERSVLRSLFLDPIRWERQSISVGNGQHRICGLRAAGSGHAFVAVGPDSTPSSSPASTV